jgi:hypothetical protein
MTAATHRSIDLDQFPEVAAFLDKYADGPGAVPAGDVVDLAGTVERAAVTDKPFVIATIDNFLPDDLYRAILDDWHTIDLKSVDLPGAEYVGSRKGAQLLNWTPDHDVNAPATTWDRVADAARSAAFARALFTRFAPTVEANLAHPGVADAADPGFVLWANHDHGPDEALGAHLDGLHKLLTIVLYVDLEGPTTPESGHLWGTTLYDIEPDAVKPVEFSPNASREPAGHVEFHPNRAFVMPNINNALHGVTGGQEGVTRRSLMWGYWYFGSNR